MNKHERLIQLCHALAETDPHDHEYDQCIFCGGGGRDLSAVLLPKKKPSHEEGCPWQAMVEVLAEPDPREDLQCPRQPEGLHDFRHEVCDCGASRGDTLSQFAEPGDESERFHSALHKIATRDFDCYDDEWGRVAQEFAQETLSRP